ncbi:hypothetical protein E1B28_005443 [Marasmius oreades]|uniref:Mediator of RNA polymerase II transcription subunit 21 n=1 Tax=Marasmius oreades TaxID=181124 RepID=A0A9P7S3J8_9AGAR|nr:uncharacterized protein E1B28_005443 [Marasmius oreades]KAG7094620.1 hypothetical protein E1B28_005443 [Marasmius oreades]
MFQDSSNMDRVTQFQDAIQQLLLIMSSSIGYLSTRQTSTEIPVTKRRSSDKYDSIEDFEENKREVVTDLIVKAKQLEFLISSFPEAELEEEQARRLEMLEDEAQKTNEEYVQIVARTSWIPSFTSH